MADVLRWNRSRGAISFAGGIPGASLLPSLDLAKALGELPLGRDSTLLSYGDALGLPSLREAFGRYLRCRGTAEAPSRVEDVVVTSGAQGALHLAGLLLLSPGDVVVVPEPAYFGAFHAFHVVGAQVVPAPSERGMPELDRLDDLCRRHRPKLLYLNPTFQNPTGATLSAGQRSALMELAYRHGLLILEDDVLGHLQFESPPPTMRTLDPDNTVYVQSVSKTVAPGLRIGFLVLPPGYAAKAAQIRQYVDICPAPLLQRLLAGYLESCKAEQNLEKIRLTLRARRDAMRDSLSSRLSGEASWEVPDGGLFFWVRIPEADIDQLLVETRSESLVFMPGSVFYYEGGPQNELRLTFATLEEQEITNGIQRLASCIHRHLDRRRAHGPRSLNSMSEGSRA